MLWTRRAAVTGLAAALLLGGVTVPLAAPASAAPLDRHWSIRDTDGDGNAGLYHSDDGDVSFVKAEDSALSNVSQLSASRDGSRIIYVRATFVPSTKDQRWEVVVRDASKQLVQVLETRYDSAGSYPYDPALSPSGNRAVWGVYAPGKGVSTIRTLSIGSTRTTAVPNTTGYAPYAFLTEGSLLIQTVTGSPYTIGLDGTGKTGVIGLSKWATNAQVSPDGQHLAFGLITQNREPYRAKLQVAPFAFVNGVLTLSAAGTRTLDTSLYNGQPAYSLDGSTLYYRKAAGLAASKGDIWRAAVDGSTAPVRVTATSVNERDVAVSGSPAGDSTLPAAATALPAALDGKTVVLHWSTPASPELSGVLVQRRRGGNLEKQVYVRKDQTSFSDTGLDVGTTYEYSFVAVDRSGKRAAATGAGTERRTLTALAPEPSVYSPTALSTAGAPFSVIFGPVAAGAHYRVQYGEGSAPANTTWVTSTTSRILEFGAATGEGIAPTTSRPGTTYRFRVTVKDDYGNTSGAKVTTAIVPFDQESATMSGAQLVSDSRAFLGSYRRLSSPSSYAVLKVVGDHLRLIGWRCPSCGSFAVYEKGVKLATVSTLTSTMQPRRLLVNQPLLSSTSGYHVVTIRPLGTAGHPYVGIDAFAGT